MLSLNAPDRMLRPKMSTDTQINNLPVRLGRAATIAVALLFLVAPVYSLVGKGPFSWHIAQPAAWQGGAEVLALGALFYVALSLPLHRVGRLGLVLALGWLYARRHGVDLSLLLIYVYAEAIFTLGWMLLPRIGMARSLRPAAVLTAGLLGVMAWSLVIWTASASKIGSLPAIRLITLAFLGLCLVFGRAPRICGLLGRTLTDRDRIERLFVVLVAAFLLALFAKAAVVIDYDSMWYGLRADRVLVGEGNIYADQGLVAVVHFYPKLYEALQLPLAGLGSISVVFGLGIISVLMIAAAVSAILREFGMPGRVRYAAAGLVATLPAIANIAVTAKGDAFSAWLMLMALLGLVRFRKGKGGVWLWVVLSATVLAVLVRLSNLPYAALLVVLLLWSALTPEARRRSIQHVVNRGVWLAVGAALLTGLILARTYLLTGLLFIAPNSLVSLQEALGLELRYPAGLLPGGGERLPVIEGLRSMLFDPATLPHIIITWPGNVWAFLPLALVLMGGWHARDRMGSWPLLILGVSFFAVLFCYPMLIPGGDGNYFIFPVVCLLLWGMIRIGATGLHASRVLTALLLAFALVGAAVSFVTGSWGPGTRALDINFRRLPLEYTTQRSNGIATAHLQGVEKFFKGQSASTRVVGLEIAGHGVQLPSGWWLPVRFEPVDSYGWLRPEIVLSGAGFQWFLEYAQIRYVVVPNESQSKDTAVVVRSALATSQAAGLATVAYRDAHYAVWELKKNYHARIKLADVGVATLAMPADEACNQGMVATIAWSTSLPSIAIEVKAESGLTASMWAELGGTGQQKSGPWVKPGVEFIFRRGRGGEVLGTLEVAPNCD
jgi:hypothetical protein